MAALVRVWGRRRLLATGTGLAADQCGPGQRALGRRTRSYPWEIRATAELQRRRCADLHEAAAARWQSADARCRCGCERDVRAAVRSSRPGSSVTVSRARARATSAEERERVATQPQQAAPPINCLCQTAGPTCSDKKQQHTPAGKQTASAPKVGDRAGGGDGGEFITAAFGEW